MLILSIDPATHAGWALRNGDDVTACGTWDLSIRRDESAGMRLLRFRAKVTEIIEGNKALTLVVFEAARNCAPSMQGALVVQAELQGVLKALLEDLGMQYRGYSPTEIKKRATGKGNASKDAMVAAARAKWPGLNIPDDNTADALWIADLAMRDVGAQGKTQAVPP